MEKTNRAGARLKPECLGYNAIREIRSSSYKTVANNA